MDYLVPIIIGSESDLEIGLKIQKIFKTYFNIKSEIRICSAHKACLELLKILQEYECKTNVKLYITIAGKSNALSALVDGNSSKPVISCPPLKDSSMYDIYSSISMPSGISPLTILGAENAVISATKIIGLSCDNLKEQIIDYKNNMQTKLHIQDIKCKYEINNCDILNSDSLNNCIKNTQIDEPSFTDLQLLRTGKVRDIYTYPDTNDLKNEEYIMVASDRVSAFDRHLTTIPHKGIVLHKISNWWFEQTQNMVPNHIISSLNNRTMIVKKCQVLPIEFVMRAYMTGSTETSIWKNYEKGCRNYCGHTLQDGMIKNQKLPEILLTPTTKDEHDEIISEQEIYDRNIIEPYIFKQCQTYAFKLFTYGQNVAKQKGLILVDTKYEFGLDIDGNICLIDELHTPDSSRYWLKHSYTERFNNNQEPESIDKEVVRKWVKDNCDDPYNLNNNIEIPDDIRLKLSSKYLQLYELITGKII